MSVWIVGIESSSGPEHILGIFTTFEKAKRFLEPLVILGHIPEMKEEKYYRWDMSEDDLLESEIVEDIYLANTDPILCVYEVQLDTQISNRINE